MEHTPKNIVIQLGALIALYLSVSFLLTLVFGLINLAFPMATEGYWEIENANDSIRLGIAMLVVFFPTYIILTRLVNQNRRQEHATQQYLTRWLIYLSLLLAGLVLLITLVTVIYTFLNGDMTARFILKAGTVMAVTASAFYYYLKDLNGYWVNREPQSKLYGAIVSLVVLLAIVLGFMHIATPAEVRELKLDEQQINDLRNIQWQLENYLETSTSTPATLEAAYTDPSHIPSAPEGRDTYTYEVTNEGFRLCATFSKDAVDRDFHQIYREPDLRIRQSENWNYQAGRYCFERTVN